MRAALVCRDRRITYAQLADRIGRVGDLLAVYLDTVPGDRVAVLAENSIAYVDLYLGVPAHERVIVPLNTRWSEPELRYALQDSEARVLFTDRDVGPLAEHVDRVVRTDLEYEILLAAARPVTPHTGPPGDVAGLFYTGGTTGAAKGVMLTRANLDANARAMQQIAPLTADDVFLVMAPMFHAAGTTSVLYSVDAGARQVVMPFDADAVLDVLEDEQATHTLAVPTMLAALVAEQRANPRDVSSLRVLMHGGSPITPALVRQAVDEFPDAVLVHLYGTTETSPIISALHDTRTSRSVGTPVGCEVRLADDGEVCVRGPNVMKGYWHKPDVTAEVLQDGWYCTGDVGTFDDDGNLHILDRKHDVIVTGGENVYPSEVEAALSTHPAVDECAVYGVPDDRWGEAVHAAVVARGAVRVQELVDHCRGLIATYKVPQGITFVDTLPRSGAGKVLRRALRG